MIEIDIIIIIIIKIRIKKEEKEDLVQEVVKINKINNKIMKKTKIYMNILQDEMVS